MLSSEWRVKTAVTLPKSVENPQLGVLVVREKFEARIACLSIGGR